MNDYRPQPVVVVARKDMSQPIFSTIRKANHKILTRLLYLEFN